MPAAPDTRTRIVQSRQNGRVKQLRAALARPGPAMIGLEGMHLVEEALRSGIEVQTIFVRAGSESLVDKLDFSLLACLPEVLSVSSEILASVVTTETPQPIAALAVPPVFGWDQVFRASGASVSGLLLVVLAAVQDPGNVGTIVRSAEAFGANGVVVLPGTASLWNPKSLRASMGSAFRLPVLAATAEQALASLRAHGVASLAAVAPGHRGAQQLSCADLRRSIALWIGSEGAGLSPAVVASCEAAITIPCPGPVESLNAAVAASVLLYEASRQRLSSA